MGVCDANARKASRGTANQYQRRKHKLGYRWSTFKAQAKRRHKPLDISLHQFELLVKSPCHYCGEAPEGPGGIDRRDNELDPGQLRPQLRRAQGNTDGGRLPREGPLRTCWQTGVCRAAVLGTAGSKEGPPTTPTPTPARARVTTWWI